MIQSNNARTSQANRQPVISRTRDRISNGRIASRDIDLRSRLGRRFTFLVQSYSAELGDVLTESELTLVKQIASLQLQIEQMQGLIIGGQDVDADQVIRLSSEHRRLLATLKSKADKATPAPSDVLQRYLAENYGEHSDEDIPDETPGETETAASAEPEAAEIP
jgi:hypothetical protein